jgi:glycine/D-amino acid oxidase-like deaminating enzyme
MGCSLALFLARRGARVTLIEHASEPIARASRWNEGKIHLGFLYAGDPTFATARKLIPGGLAFRPLVEELVGRSIEGALSQPNDLYLAHRDSVVDAAAMERYLAQVAKLVAAQAGGGDFSVAPKRLTPAELAEITPAPEIVAGFRVPERSVHTGLIADWFVEALRAEPMIDLLLSCRVSGVAEDKSGWRIVASPPAEATFDVIINALWEGRSAIDKTAGLGDSGTWSYRYRLSLFARAARECRLPSAVIATGPFGDMKNYNGRDLYLSWYPAGLMADLAAPEDGVQPHANEAIIEATLTSLAHFFPDLRDALAGAQIGVKGGWIVAPGGGSLADPASALHRRDRFGVSRRGCYFSVDTGKYSTAPWLARRIADEVLG